MTEHQTEAERLAPEELAHELWAMAQGLGPVEEVAGLIAERIRSYGAEERERCALLAQTLTYRRRWIKAVTNGTPDNVLPCEIAAAIRAGLDAASPVKSETPAAGGA